MTTEQPTTQKNTTQTPTTETPTTEKEYPTYDYKIVYDNDAEEIYDKLYKVDNEAAKANDDDYVDSSEKCGYDKINLNIENDIIELFMFSDTDIFKNTEYLKYLGKVEAYDEYGSDISDNIVFAVKTVFNKSTRIYIYVEDSFGNAVYKWVWIS